MICRDKTMVESHEPTDAEHERSIDLDHWEVLLKPRTAAESTPASVDTSPSSSSTPADLNSDSARESRPETLVLTADREITLQCGKASITLTRAGKVLIRGAYVGIISSGVNRIQGGSVQIN